jgi:hypothetical protein
MPTSRRLYQAVWVLFTLVLTPASARAQATQKLLYTPIAPCRIANTSTPIGSAETVSFQVLGPTTNYLAQGGSASGCGIPDLGKVQAVFFNFVAKNPVGAGNLRAYAGDGTLPAASTLNFQLLSPNLNIANGIAIPVRTTGSPGPGVDLKVFASTSTGVVIDAVGYVSLAARRKFYLTQTAAQDGAGADTACGAGYHFAALSEIFDTTQLEYDTTLGYTNEDSGQGLPSAISGWVRTGYLSFTTAFAGQSNCANWSSSSAGDYGTFVLFSPNWLGAATVVSPWAANTQTCNNVGRSWCVQD